jgi:cation/acetate symporter
MRSITFVQAFQYWLKLTALAVPLVFLLMAWQADGAPALGPQDAAGWQVPLTGPREYGLYSTYSLILATFLGTMGLPHVLVRFYTNPDGRAARRTTLVVLSLLGAFYLLPALYGWLGRLYVPDLVRTDAVVLTLPGRMVGGTLGELLTALVTAGAFAAFLSTSSGLTVSVAGVIAQDLLRGGVRSFRVATVLAVIVPLVLALWAWRSRWRRRRSARCWCSASGGGGSAPRARWPGCSWAAGWPAPRCWSRSSAGRTRDWRTRCWPSRPPGRCRSRSR